MRTILDDSKTWFLQSLSFDGELLITLAEGIKGDQAEALSISDVVIGDAYPVRTQPTSKIVSVRFTHYVAWQLVNEAFTAFDEYEERDDKSFLQILSKSKYLEYVNENHGWYADVIGSANHYRVWSENEVIDVISCVNPEIELIKTSSPLTSEQ